MNSKMELDISEADLERMEAEAKKPQPRKSKQELVLGDEELDLPDFPR